MEEKYTDLLKIVVGEYLNKNFDKDIYNLNGLQKKIFEYFDSDDFVDYVENELDNIISEILN